MAEESTKRKNPFYDDSDDDDDDFTVSKEDLLTASDADIKEFIVSYCIRVYELLPDKYLSIVSSLMYWHPDWFTNSDICELHDFTLPILRLIDDGYAEDGVDSDEEVDYDDFFVKERELRKDFVAPRDMYIKAMLKRIHDLVNNVQSPEGPIVGHESPEKHNTNDPYHHKR